MSKVNDILLNLSAKKIQKFFTYSLVIKNHSKFVKKFLDSQIDLSESKNIDFGKFSKLIRQKDVIEITKKLIDSLFTNQNLIKCNIQPKIFLTSFLLLFFKEDLIGVEDQLNDIDNSLIDWVNEVTSKVINLKNELRICKYDCTKVKILLNNFQIIFDQWKNYDKSKLIESILISYNNRCEHIEKIVNNNDDTIFENLNAESKNEMILTLEEQKNELLKQLKLTDPGIDIEYIKENSHSIIEQMTKSYEIINNEVAATMKKAFYDMLCGEVESGNMLPIFDLLKDINNRLLILVPRKNKNSFSKKFDDKTIIDILSSNSWSQELIDHINFMIDTIFVLGAPSDDKEIKEWKNHIMSLTKDNFSKNLPLVLIQIQEKIDRIFFLLKELNKDE